MTTQQISDITVKALPELINRQAEAIADLEEKGAYTLSLSIRVSGDHIKYKLSSSVRTAAEVEFVADDPKQVKLPLGEELK